jgi:hypothetical protein
VQHGMHDTGRLHSNRALHVLRQAVQHGLHDTGWYTAYAQGVN